MSSCGEMRGKVVKERRREKAERKTRCAASEVVKPASGADYGRAHDDDDDDDANAGKKKGEGVGWGYGEAAGACRQMHDRCDVIVMDECLGADAQGIDGQADWEGGGGGGAALLQTGFSL